jgi:hypothetical protein
MKTVLIFFKCRWCGMVFSEAERTNHGPEDYLRVRGSIRGLCVFTCVIQGALGLQTASGRGMPGKVRNDPSPKIPAVCRPPFQQEESAAIPIVAGCVWGGVAGAGRGGSDEPV